MRRCRKEKEVEEKKNNKKYLQTRERHKVSEREGSRGGKEGFY
jgi:hypothetical protein